MNNCVEIKNITKNFENIKALDNINLNLNTGKIIALLGADGSGKTTLLRLIIGLLYPDSGKILTLNLDPIKDKDKLIQNIGYMPQKFGLYEDLTVIENLKLHSRLKNTNSNFDKLLDFTTLKPFKNRLVANLSGGMKQKLGLACALIAKPQLLILDEPTNGVDPLSRIELLTLVKNMIDKNTTVIWSSAYLDEAYNFEYSIVLDKGKIIFGGSTIELGKNYDIFEEKVIHLMGGYHNKISKIANNYCIDNYDKEYIVVADKLSKNFGNFTAVKNNTFNIKKGEIFGLLGPNGAGKSTTFQMMCALIKPTSGRAYIKEVDVIKKPEKARKYIGYMAQKFSLYSNLTVLDNLNFFSGLYGLYGDRKNEKIKEMLKIFELEKYKNTNSFLLPLGFKQRLSLACALIHEPPILFLDEPTSGVDVIQRREFWSHIKELSKIGVSVLVTTHFMDEARFCDNVSLFYNGEIIALDKPTEIIKKTSSKDFQEAFIKLIKKAKNDE